MHAITQGGVLLIPATEARSVKLKSIVFIKPNNLTKLRAAWNSFVYYYDPKLGTCFAMASPIFFNKAYSSFVQPFIWGLLILALVAIGLIKLSKLDGKYATYVMSVFLMILFLFWLILDLRTNVYYGKAVFRNIDRFWGKSLIEKRGIVNNSPDFIDFISFCDKHIPLDAQIVNLVAKDIPGTAHGALANTQTSYNLRPRLVSAKKYYIVYGEYDKEKVKGLKLFKQFHPNAFIMVE